MLINKYRHPTRLDITCYVIAFANDSALLPDQLAHTSGLRHWPGSPVITFLWPRPWVRPAAVTRFSTHHPAPVPIGVLPLQVI